MIIALEGGGSRSVFSAGVLTAIAESNIRIEAIVGSSSGIVNAAYFAAGQLDELRALWMNADFGRRLINWGRFFNPFGGPGVDIDTLVDSFLVQSGGLDPVRATSGPTRLFACATDIETGEGITAEPKPDNLADWMRASMALPVAYNRVAVVEGHRCVDGGVASPVPFDIELGDDLTQKRIAIITRPLDTPKPPPRMWQRVFIRSIVPREARPITLIQHEHHNRTIDRMKAAMQRGELFVVDPEPGMPVSRLTKDIHTLEQGFDCGLARGRAFAQALAED